MTCSSQPRHISMFPGYTQPTGKWWCTRSWWTTPASTHSARYRQLKVVQLSRVPWHPLCHCHAAAAQHPHRKSKHLPCWPVRWTRWRLPHSAAFGRCKPPCASATSPGSADTPPCTCFPHGHWPADKLHHGTPPNGRQTGDWADLQWDGAAATPCTWYQRSTEHHWRAHAHRTHSDLQHVHLSWTGLCTLLFARQIDVIALPNNCDVIFLHAIERCDMNLCWSVCCFQLWKRRKDIRAAEQHLASWANCWPSYPRRQLSCFNSFCSNLPKALHKNVLLPPNCPNLVQFAMWRWQLPLRVTLFSCLTAAVADIHLITALCTALVKAILQSMLDSNSVHLSSLDISGCQHKAQRDLQELRKAPATFATSCPDFVLYCACCMKMNTVKRTFFTHSAVIWQ